MVWDDSAKSLVLLRIQNAKAFVLLRIQNAKALVLLRIQDAKALGLLRIQDAKALVLLRIQELLCNHQISPGVKVAVFICIITTTTSCVGLHLDPPHPRMYVMQHPL